MELIDKAAVVAEIERRIKKYATIDVGDSGELDALYGAKCKALTEILSFIDTLEVKEVDLDLEIILWANAIPEIRLDDVERLARYFFELGLKAKGAEGICKISETEYPNFDEAQGTPITK